MRRKLIHPEAPPGMTTMVYGLEVQDTQMLSYSNLSTILTYIFSVTAFVAFFGILSNIANIVVFYKMGFSSVSNISLFCLAIVDFCSLCIILIFAVGNLPVFQNAYLTISFLDVSLAIGSVYYSFSAMGSWITAVISLERSCCIVFPMKVKLFFTRRNVVCLIAGMVAYQIASATPRSFAITLTRTTSPLTNQTIFVFKSTNQAMDIASILASYSIPTFVCFFIVVVATVFLISRFNHSRRFRDSMVRQDNRTEKISDKDMRLSRTVVLICIIFIIGATPNVFMFFAIIVYPELHVAMPRLGNITYVMVHIGVLFHAISSSINIFVYFRMGRKFRSTFKEPFFSCKKL